MANEKRVYLRALEPDDYIISYKWRNNHELTQYLLDIPRYVSKETERKWVLKAIKEHETGKAIRLAICLRENDRLIGYIYLTSVDFQNRSCELHHLIGEADCLGKGYAVEAEIIILEYAFVKLGMERVYLETFSTNIPAVKHAEKFGYKKEGQLRNAVYRRGKFYDTLLYSMLREEFLEKYLDNQ